MGLTSTDQNWCPSQTCLLTPNLRCALPRMLPLNRVMVADWCGCADMMHQCLCWCSEHFTALHWTELMLLVVFLGSWCPFYDTLRETGGNILYSFLTDDKEQVKLNILSCTHAWILFKNIFGEVGIWSNPVGLACQSQVACLIPVFHC